ncbi:MAG TPA: NifB/NifX family molybdenum-iron cluster-binding protein [Victivallales bacterium]|nr:NifB/NifX family molybdenum-iron cluster-binding protein [Victivallales bacterium]
MKIAFSSSGDSLESPFDSRFGRCSKFIIYDDSSDSFDVVDNTQNLNAVQGAGIQAAQNVVKAGAVAVVSGHCGPKAFKALNVAGLKVYNCEFRTVKEAVSAFKKGELKEADSADVDGHW